MESYKSMISRALQALEHDDEDAARRLALRAFASRPEGATHDKKLVALLSAVEAHGEAIALASQMLESSGQAQDAITLAHALTESGDLRSGYDVLRHAASDASMGDSREIAERLIILAIARRDVDGLEQIAGGYLRITDSEWATAAATRALELARADELTQEMRRIAYVFSGSVVLGGEECEDDEVADYWFFTHDDHTVAWTLRRLSCVAASLGWRFGSVVSSDPKLDPVVSAATHILKCDESSGEAPTLKILGIVNNESSLEKSTHEIVFAMGFDGDWNRLTAWGGVDILGLPVEGEIELEGDILAAYEQLPPDRAVAAITAFYERFQFRTPALTLSRRR